QGPLQQLPIRIVNILTPKYKSYFVNPVIRRHKISHAFQCDLRCVWDRIAVSTATDRRKSNRLDSVFNRELQRTPITIRQGLRLAVFSPSPNRTNCVNHKACGQTISARNFRFTGWTAAKGPAFCKQLRSSAAMNRAIDSSSAEK